MRNDNTMTEEEIMYENECDVSRFRVEHDNVYDENGLFYCKYMMLTKEQKRQINRA